MGPVCFDRTQLQRAAWPLDTSAAIAPRHRERLQPCLRLRALQQRPRACQPLTFRKTFGHERNNLNIELERRYSWSLAAIRRNIPQLPGCPRSRWV